MLLEERLNGCNSFRGVSLAVDVSFVADVLFPVFPPELNSSEQLRFKLFLSTGESSSEDGSFSVFSLWLSAEVCGASLLDEDFCGGSNERELLSWFLCMIRE